MTQGKLVRAYAALGELAREKWPVKEAYALYRLKKRLQEAYDFQIERERALLKQYGGEPAEGGAWAFPTVRARRDFEAEIAALKDMEPDVEIIPAEVKPPEGMTVTPDALDALDGIVKMAEE